MQDSAFTEKSSALKMTLMSRGFLLIVYGEVKSKSNPNGRTILFYNHYDVKPVEPVGLWNRHPFSGDITEGKIWGEAELRQGRVDSAYPRCQSSLKR